MSKVLYEQKTLTMENTVYLKYINISFLLLKNMYFINSFIVIEKVLEFVCIICSHKVKYQILSSIEEDILLRKL